MTHLRADAHVLPSVAQISLAGVPLHGDVAFVHPRLLRAGDALDQRGLAGAVGAEQSKDFVLGNAEAEAL